MVRALVITALALTLGACGQTQTPSDRFLSPDDEFLSYLPIRGVADQDAIRLGRAICGVFDAGGTWADATRPSPYMSRADVLAFAEAATRAYCPEYARRT